MTIHYGGRRFRAVRNDGKVAPLAHYHQDGDLVWGDFAGGEVRRGSLTGRSRPDGTLEFGYTMVLQNGEVVSGHCISTPELLPDARIRLHERYRRFTPTPSDGSSVIEEVA